MPIVRLSTCLVVVFALAACSDGRGAEAVGDTTATVTALSPIVDGGGLPDGDAPPIADAGGGGVVANIQGIARATLQTCTGGATVLGVDQTAVLTCPVAAPSGASHSFIVPELYAPGIPSDSRCVQPAEKPHVIMVGNQFNVTATFVNRCAEPHPLSESGLGWMLYERDDTRIGNVDAGPRPATRFTGVSRGKLESCVGSTAITLAPGDVQTLTCDVKTLGAERVLLTPETNVPGTGCLVTDASPRVIIEAGHLAVTSKLRNRCPFNARMSEGGLAWMRFVRGSGVNASILFDNVASATFQTCRGSADLMAPGATTSFGCSVATPPGIRDALVTPELFVPGNGCVVAATPPHVFMIGLGFGVTTTLVNRCAAPTPQSEGGLGWVLWQRPPTLGPKWPFVAGLVNSFLNHDRIPSVLVIRMTQDIHGSSYPTRARGSRISLGSARHGACLKGMRRSWISTPHHYLFRP